METHSNLIYITIPLEADKLGELPFLNTPCKKECSTGEELQALWYANACFPEDEE